MDVQLFSQHVFASLNLTGQMMDIVFLHDFCQPDHVERPRATERGYGVVFSHTSMPRVETDRRHDSFGSVEMSLSHELSLVRGIKDPSFNTGSIMSIVGKISL